MEGITSFCYSSSTSHFYIECGCILNDGFSETGSLFLLAFLGFSVRSFVLHFRCVRILSLCVSTGRRRLWRGFRRIKGGKTTVGFSSESWISSLSLYICCFYLDLDASGNWVSSQLENSQYTTGGKKDSLRLRLPYGIKGEELARDALPARALSDYSAIIRPFQTISLPTTTKIHFHHHPNPRSYDVRYPPKH